MAYTLTGQYVHGNGAPRRGRIKFAPSVAIAGDATVILPSPLTVDLDSGGSFSVPLVGTDDDAYSPSGWVWSCTEVLDGGRTFSFELTADSDIHSLAPIAVPDDDYVTMVPVAREVIAGAGLTGGGSLNADRTFDVGAGVGITVNADDVAVIYGTTAGTAAQGNDSRLSDARTPTAHAASHGAGQADEITVELSQVSDAGGAAALEVGTTTGTVAAGDDSRFTDARTPTAHAASHGAGQADEITVELSQVSDAGGAAALEVGTTTGTVAAGDDSRFTDARTPTAHAASHGAGQADAITVAQSQVSGLDTALAAKMSNTVADANSVLYAVTDDTPAALAVAASRIVGRKATGDVSAMTAAEALTVLGVSVTHPNTDDVLVTVAGQTVHYDSGWRNIVSLADGALTVNEGLKVRRVNSSVFLVIGLTTPSGWSSGATLATLPLGFRPGTSDIYLPPAYGGTPAYAIVFRGGEIKAYQSGTYTIRAVPTFTCADGIPASLPGTLISAAPA